MELRKKPLVVAVSLAMVSAVGVSTAKAAPGDGWEDPYGHVPYYQYRILEEPAGVLPAGPALAEATQGGTSQETLEDPIFLYVGEFSGDFPYDRQNPDAIIAEGRDGVEITDWEWESPSIVVNTSQIVAAGEVDPNYSDEFDYESAYYSQVHPAIGIVIKHAELTGLSAADADASLLSSLPVFEGGSERVSIYNQGVLFSEGHNILILGEDYPLDPPTVLRGNIINRTAGENAPGLMLSLDHNVVVSYATLQGDIVNDAGRGITLDDLFASPAPDDDPLILGELDDNGMIYPEQGGMVGLQGNIAFVEGARLEGNIINRGLMASPGSVVYLNDAHIEGRIVNAPDAVMFTESSRAAIDVRNITGELSIEQHGVLAAIEHQAISEELGVAMNLSGSNISALLAAGEVIGDIDFEGATVTLAGGEYQGTIRNRGGVFVVDGIHAIDGAYEQDADATLQFSSDRRSGLSAQRVTLADGSTLVFGSGESYRNGNELVLLEADELDFDLGALNLETASGFYRVSEVALSEDGRQLLVSYAGVDGREVARRAIDVSGARGAKARQLDGLGQALNRVLQNGNQQAVAALIDAIGDGERLAELLPDSSGASIESINAASQAAGNVVSSRARGVAAGDAVAGKGVWLKGLYSEVEQRMRDGVEGYDSDTRGFVLGADAELHNGTVLGLGWAHSNTDTSGRDGLAEGDVDFDQLIAYTSRAYGNWLFDAQLSYGWGRNESLRRTMDETARADYDSRQRGARAAAGYAFALDGATTLTPRFSLDYSHLALDAYSESGAGAMNLSLDEQRVERFELGAQAELGHLTQISGLMVEPRLTLGIFHDLQGKANSNLAAFAFASEDTFLVQGGGVDKTRYTAGVGVDVYSEGGFTTSLDLSHGWTDSMTANAGELTLRYDF